MLSANQGGGEGQTMDPALRSRILEQAQRFLLALVVHDPSRRASCAEEAKRRGLYLGSERRQWLFDAVTSAATAAATGAGTGTGTELGTGLGPGPGTGTGTSTAGPSAAAPAIKGETTAAATGGATAEGKQTEGEEKSDEPWTGPSAEALEAGGEMLFAEIRAAAPPGYFGLKGRARPHGDRDGRGEGEGTLDWVFERKEAVRVAKGGNVDLVLLEVVMVMLKEKVKCVCVFCLPSSGWTRLWAWLGWTGEIRENLRVLAMICRLPSLTTYC